MNLELIANTNTNHRIVFLTIFGVFDESFDTIIETYS